MIVAALRDSLLPKYRHPGEFGYSHDGTLFLCGHFDGYDVYRVVNRREFVLVFGNDPAELATVSWSMAAHWRQRNPEMLESGPMRAAIKAQRSIREQYERLLEQLMRGDQACLDAADWLDALKEGVGL